jgi:type IV secretory pathway VirB4 component
MQPSNVSDEIQQACYTNMLAFIYIYRERDEALKKLTDFKKENLHLTKKIQRLQEKIENSTDSTPPVMELRHKRYVINLDSEDEDGDEDDIVVSNSNQAESRDERASTASLESQTRNEQRY